MRKRTISHVADTIFWYVLYFLPIIAYLLLCLAEPSSGADTVNFHTFLQSWGVSNGVISDTLYNLFSDESSIGMTVFAEYGVFDFFQWYVGVYLIHLCIDFLMFLPKLGHKWMNSFLRGDE